MNTQPFQFSHSQDSYFKMWNLLGTFEPSSQEYTRAPAQHRKIKSKNDNIKANMQYSSGIYLYHQTSLCEEMLYKYQRGLKKLFLFISAFMFYCCEKSTWSQTHKSMDFGRKKSSIAYFPCRVLIHSQVIKSAYLSKGHSYNGKMGLKQNGLYELC